MRKEELQKEIERLLGVELKEIQFDGEKDFQKINELTVIDLENKKIPLILKRRNDKSEFAFYEEFLSKYDLDSPKWYGYIQIGENPFLLLEKVNYIKPIWGDYERTKSALKWLIKKDKICQQNFGQIHKMTSLGKMQWYGIEEWLHEFEVGSKNKVNPEITQEFWSLISSNKEKLQNILYSLENSNHKTICHGDTQMGNILFADESLRKVFVIDWTQPHLTSVCRDLAQLVDYIPKDRRQELIEEYKKEFGFEGFDKEFECAVIIRDLSYLSWMVMMFNDGEGESIYQSEVKRVAERLRLSLSTNS